MAYKIVMQPEGKNPGVLKKAAGEAGLLKAPNENVGGIVIYLQDGSGRREEVSRVAFIRRASKNPNRSFQDQLKTERERAEHAVATLNELMANAGELV